MFNSGWGGPWLHLHPKAQTVYWPRKLKIRYILDVSELFLLFYYALYYFTL